MVSVVANCVKQKKMNVPQLWTEGRHERELLSILNAHNSATFCLEKKKKKPQMLNFSTLQWDSLNCTCKSGNVGQACKICVHSLLSLFLSVVVNVVEKENGTILPILYECLICIQVFISTF